MRDAIRARVRPEPVPFYVTTSGGQIRAFRLGAGPDLVVLAGLTLGASRTAERVAAACPAWRVTAFELPGIGGSADHAAEQADASAISLAEAMGLSGIEGCALFGCELAGALLPAVAAALPTPPAVTLWHGHERALAWAACGTALPDLEPRTDGTHLTALWSFLRDRHVLKAADPTQPDPFGEAIPTPEELDGTLVAAAVRPERFAGLWQTLAAVLPSRKGGPNGAEGGTSPFAGWGGDHHVSTGAPRPPSGRSGLPPPRGEDSAVRALGALSELPAALPAPPARSSRPLAPPRALPDGGIWHQEVATARGRMHLRRVGGEGRPLLVIPTGGGSSAQFAPVLRGLARGRQTFAVDYLGNGLSEKPHRPGVTIGDLAEDMAALVEALGFPALDVWGSHTGAVVGLELALRHPAKVGRLVMEGPVFISPDFQADLLERYFPPIAPDTWGRHLPLGWNWRRDMFLFWPWYRVERAAARQLGLPSPQHLHDYAIGILESGPTYDGAYRAAFSYDTASRLPGLSRPALVTAGPNDMLVNALAETRALNLPNVEVRETPTTVWWPDPDAAAAQETLAIYDAFLNG